MGSCCTCGCTGTKFCINLLQSHMLAHNNILLISLWHGWVMHSVKCHRFIFNSLWVFQEAVVRLQWLDVVKPTELIYVNIWLLFKYYNFMHKCQLLLQNFCTYNMVTWTVTFDNIKLLFIHYSLEKSCTLAVEKLSSLWHIPVYLCSILKAEICQFCCNAFAILDCFE